MSNLAITWAWQQEVGTAEKLALICLADRASDAGICWPGIEDIQHRTGHSEASIHRLLAGLIKVGLLQRRERFAQTGGQLSNLWLLPIYGAKVTGGQFPPEQEIQAVLDHLARYEQQGGIAHDTGGGIAHDTGGVSPMIPKPSIEPSSLEPPVSIHGENGKDSKMVWPDWYATLYAIPGFKVPLTHAQAWLDKKGVPDERAEETAYALKSKWPGPTRSPYKDAWATFQHWVVRPLLNSQNGGNANARSGFNSAGLQRTPLKHYDPGTDELGR